MDIEIAEPELDELLDEEQDTEEILEPPYKVIIHNDDVTPMDFVTYVLEDIFQLPSFLAISIMYTAHFKGVALVAVYPQSEAQRRVGKAHFAASLDGYPLTFTMEPEGG